MGGKAIRRAALITPRRAILERFPPDAKRTARDHYANGWGMRAESLAYARWRMPFSDQMHEAQQLLISRFPAGIFARGWI